MFPPSVGATLVRPFHLLLLVATTFLAVTWGGGIIAGARWNELAEYLLLLSFYGLASAYYLILRFKRGNFRLFDVPVFLTILGFVEFGLAPLTGFADPGSELFRADPRSLVHALFYFIFGMGAFWIGSTLLRRASVADDLRVRQEEVGESAPNRIDILVRASVLFVIGLLAKFYLLQSSLYSYTESENALFSNLNILQLLWTAADLGTCALLVASIERFKYPADPTRRVLFWTVFILESIWGLISGMKYLFLKNFLMVAIVSSYVEGKVRKAWIVAPLLALLAIYPFSDAYRNLVRTNVRVNSLAAAQDASRLALSESLQDESDARGWVLSGWQRTMHRLSLLQSMSLVMELGPRGARLEGQERWWMVPLYPFVPRFLWPNKPFLNKAQRLSILLNLGPQTSTALTYPGDLYLELGLPGVLVGMFLLGVVGQWLAYRVVGPSADRHLLVYAVTFMVVADLENDAFLLWVSVIKTIVVMMLVAWLIYGPCPNSAVSLLLRRLWGRHL
jgi:hypothetical protein